MIERKLKRHGAAEGEPHHMRGFNRERFEQFRDVRSKERHGVWPGGLVRPAVSAQVHRDHAIAFAKEGNL
jgi:hypothetical protein